MIESAINKPAINFDYLFTGLGAANCLLILRLHDNGLLIGKTIAIIEPDSKSTNDRTFCFWATEDEVTKLHLKPLISYSWGCIEIGGIVKQEIYPLRYFHVKGIDLYNATKTILAKTDVTFYSSFLIQNPEEREDILELKLEGETIYANKVFDSRPPSFIKTKKNESHLYQSFYGFKIKSTKKSFDTSTMVMMDFNVLQNNFTQFIYILPFTEDTALIELTRFGTQKLSRDEAGPILTNYINKLGLSFEILEEEQGVIPMSSANIEIEDFGKNWIPMGARANMLKSTSGYAFHSMAEDAIVQMEAIKNNLIPIRKFKKQRFTFYDRLLLKILDERPEFGKIIFETLFKKVPMTRVLSFLREKTSLSEEILIFLSLPKTIFIKAAIKDLLHQITKLPVLVLPFLFTMLALILSFNHFKYISWSILAIGFLSVGLSHGALDHLTSKKISSIKQFVYFIASYLFKGLLLGLVWFFFPDIALVLFIVYSAWHFGQADFREWKLKQGWQSFLWGFVVLMTILFFHFEEMNWILQQIPNLNAVQLLKNISETHKLFFKVLIVGSGLLLAVFHKSKHILFTLIYLLISSMLPLLVAFGIYFVGQHSMHGWRHLSVGLDKSSSSLWLKSLPFSFGGACIILYFIFFAGSNYVGMFFIILSCLSIPHVLSMHQFYEKLNR